VLPRIRADVVAEVQARFPALCATIVVEHEVPEFVEDDVHPPRPRRVFTDEDRPLAEEPDEAAIAGDWSTAEAHAVTPQDSEERGPVGPGPEFGVALSQFSEGGLNARGSH
jgi:hypothetical protein